MEEQDKKYCSAQRIAHCNSVTFVSKHSNPGVFLNVAFLFFYFDTAYRFFKFLPFLLTIITYEKYIFIIEVYISMKSLNLSLTNYVFVLLKKND